MHVLAVVLLTVAALTVPAPVLAGDVVAVAKGGKLTIKGSADSDEVSLALSGQDVRVAPGGATTLNGGFVPQTFTVTGSITANLGAGDDMLFLDSIPIATDLKVKLGDGFDAFRLGGATVGGTTTIKSGKGTDVVR